MNAPLLARPLGVRRARATDRDAIAAFVHAHPDATPFHLPEWLEAIEAACGQRADWLVAEQANGAIAGVLPLTRMHSALFGRALVSSGFAVDGGILGSTDAVAPLAQAAQALATREGFPSIELRGGAFPDGWRRDETTYVGFARDLAVDDSAELLAIPRKQRAEVRKSLDGDLTVEIGRDRAAADAHYRVYSETVRNLGTPVFPRALMREVLARMDADVLTVRHAGVPVASVLSLYWRGTVLPYWGGGTQAARGLRANERMYYELMRHARARGCTRFDFGRSKVGTGPAAFKKNWGFDAVPLAYASWSAAGEKREVNPLNPKYALMVRTWKRLPLPIANLVGPWVSRGLG